MTDAPGSILLRSIAAVLVFFIGCSVASAQTRMSAGTLTCKSKGSIGLVLGSRDSLTCTYTPTTGAPQFYTAVINKFGLDLGIKGRATLIWTVLGASTNLPVGQLDGRYVGVSADAAIGIGAGAKALIGGSNRSVVLQPVSVQGQLGLNLSVGVADLVLTYEP